MRFKKFTTTMNEQLKLTLASGVVHGLKCRLKHDTKSIFRITAFDFLKNTVTLSSELGHVYGTWSIDDIELLMHPTSKLTDAILPDGKIPIVELAKICYDYNWSIDKDSKWPTAKCDEGYFQFWDNSFVWFNDGIISAPNQLVLFDQLDAWHINYRGVEAVEI